MEYVVKKTVQIKATPEKVWEALTNPEKTKKYFFGCQVFSNWEEGSPITFKGKILYLFPIEMTGKILKAVPAKLLKYTLTNGKANPSASFSTVTDELKYVNGITTVSITDDVGQGEGAAKRYKRSQKGWDKILKGLKKLSEEG